MRLAQVILFTGDAGRLRDFYVGALGLSVLEDSPGWIRLDAGRGVLALHDLPGEPTGDPARRREDSYWKPCFQVDDVEVTRARLVAAGVAMGEVHRFGEVVFCDGTDPDGNIFQITVG
jgi:catechol 2,3-dioxygenase-like lactoylglutathione lyase family enzyme